MMKRKLVCGVGLNDADYVVRPSVNGKQVVCPFYNAWTHMLRRCYSEKLQERQPTYVGCSVCKEWLTFSNFKKWMQQQDWKGKQLDKDLIESGNKEYDPNSCVFISNSLNSLLVDCAAARGAFPLGVSWNKRDSKFESKIMLNGRNKHLGYFLTTKTAHAAWQIAKKDIIYSVAIEQSNERLKAALLLRCTQLQFDIDNNLETIKL